VNARTSERIKHELIEDSFPRGLSTFHLEDQLKSAKTRKWMRGLTQCAAFLILLGKKLLFLA